MKKAPSGALSRSSLLACATFCAVSSVHAASGTWTGITSPGLWSDTLNWSAGTIADGAGSNANFNTLDLPDGIFITALDAPRTLGSLTFGDTDTATAGSWLIDNNVDPLNILTLSGSPTITVNALGTAAIAEISAEIAGTGGLVKVGAGPLVLSGINTFTGSTSVDAGTLSLNAANAYADGTTVNTGALLNINAATAIGSGTLTIAGGSLGTTTGATLTTNNAQTWNSNVTYVGPLNLNLGTGAVGTGGVAREVISSAGNLITGGVVTAPGLTKSGAGACTLYGNNLTTLTGPRLFKAGTLALLGAAPGSSTAANQGNTQRALGDITGTLTFEGGTLSLNGSTFADNATGWGNLANPITVALGQTGTLNCPPRGALTSVITGAGTLNLGVRNTRWDFNANLAGFTGTLNVSSTINPTFGDLRVNGTGQFATTRLHLGPSVFMAQLFNAANNTAGTTQNIGQLSGDVGSVLAAQPIGGRFVNWSVGALNTDSLFAGNIVNDADNASGLGECRIYKVGTGTLTLTGNNTYTGNATGIAGTQVNAGTLSIGNGGATGSLAATNAAVAAGAAIIFNRDNTAASTYPGILSGAGTVTKLGNGQVNFHGVNTYTAGTAIKGGIIGVNNAASLGNVAGPVNFTIADGGILGTAAGVVEAHSFNVATGLTASFGAATAADSLEVTTAITGAGSLAVNGSGVLTLSAPNAYAGNTSVTSGTLVAANISGSATSSGSITMTGGKLGGTGIITGAVSTVAGVEFKPGPVTPTTSGVGTLTTGGLALAGGTVFRMELTDTLTYDKIVVTNSNALTSTASIGSPILVDPRVANSTAKWTTPGNYDIIQFSGTFTGNADDLFEVPVASRQVGLTYSFAVSGNNIRLQIGGSPPSVWSTNTSGNWSDPTKWLNGSPGSVGGFADLGSAISGPQTITLDVNRTLGLLQINNANAYTIDGSSTLTFDQTVGDAEISVLLGNHTISAPLSLADPLIITLNAASDSLALLGDISGTGGIVKSSPGNLTLGGNNSFGGDLIFSNGTLTFSNNSLGAGALTLDNASLVWGPGNSQDITVGRAITFGNNPITFAMDSDVTLANNFGLTGTANLTKDGSGNLAITADTSFAGNLTVLNGNLTLGDGGAAGSTVGGINLANASSALTVSRSGDHTISNLISGTGDLVLDGTGLQSISQANTFTGTTVINGGSAVLVNTLALQSSSVIYNTAGGALNFGSNFAATLGSLEGDKDLVLENSDEFPGAVTLTVGGNNAGTTYTGILSGGGSLTKIGTGVMTLAGAQTYAGATQVNGGALELDSSVSLNNTTVSVGATGRLTSTGATINASVLSNVGNGATGGAIFEQFSGSATFASGLNSIGNANNVARIQVNGGTFTAASMQLGRTASSFTAEPVAASMIDGLQVNGGDVDIAGALTLYHGSANSSINTRIDSGSLDVGGVITIGLNNGGRWSVIHVAGGAFTSSDTGSGVVLGGPAQGNAAFLTSGGIATVERFQFGQGALAGTSTVHVSGGDLYVGSGGMVVGTSNTGFVSTLRLSGGVVGAKDSWSSAIPVATSNTFGVKAADASNVAHDITLSGPVTGTGAIVKTGGGTVALTGTLSYTGNTTVEAGSHSLSSPDLDDIATVEISATGNATLNLNYTGTDVVGGLFFDGAEQEQGTWGRIGSLTAAHTSARITGDGILNVVSDPFTPWIDTFTTLSGAQKDKTADPDNDGLTNLEEFALDGNPESGTATGKVRARIETVGADQALVITLPVRTGAVFGGAPDKFATLDKVTYTIRGTNDLVTFDQGVTEVAESSLGMPTPLSTGWAYRTFRLNGAIGGGTPRGPKGFLDLKIEEAP